MSSAILVILGLLLTLSAVAGAWVSRRVRSRVGRFLISPINPATWSSIGAILTGFFVELVAIAVVMTLFSGGGSLLVVGIGVVLLGLGVEASRFFARIERRRVVIGDLPPLHPHRYLPYGEGPRQLLTAVFLDLNRWRDVVYVFVAFPLAVLELAGVLVLWSVGLVLLSAPFWPASGAGPAIELGGQLLGGESIGPTLTALAFLIGVILLPVTASLTQGILSLHRAVVVGLLCESDQQVLRRRVETLEGSRRAVLDVEASELRRIERDLHDGAQQRLVMLAMNLGLAADRIESDPERARTMVLEARDQARATLAELRSLVRGIAPSILVDRGLVSAIQSLAGRTPVPTVVVSTLPEGYRLPDSVERAAYFVVAESLANVAKHATAVTSAAPSQEATTSPEAWISPETATSPEDATPSSVAALTPTAPGASRCEVRCRLEAASLVIEVEDDGPGGARIAPAGGLAGLAGRVGALDGTFIVTSPEGGPTLVRAVIPIAGSAPAVEAAGPEADRAPATQTGWR
jgi:signal transduction histidine kinase